MDRRGALLCKYLSCRCNDVVRWPLISWLQTIFAQHSRHQSNRPAIIYTDHCSRLIFTARCYASAVLAMGLCLCLCPSVSVTSRNSTSSTDFLMVASTQQRHCRKVEVVHTRLSSVGFRSWSRFLAVSLQVMWVINPTVGCHYGPPGLQLPPQPLRGLLPILLLGEQRHNGCEQFA